MPARAGPQASSPNLASNLSSAMYLRAGVNARHARVMGSMDDQAKAMRASRRRRDARCGSVARNAAWDSAKAASGAATPIARKQSAASHQAR